MKWVKVPVEGTSGYYWTWRDLPYVPYAWLDKKELSTLPKPFYLSEIHPDCPIGWETTEDDEYTNIISLPKRFEEIKMDADLRKDLRRIEKKNNDVTIFLNEKKALEKSKHWFLEQWQEDKKDFQRRLSLWEKQCYTLSAYAGNELLGVHIAMKDEQRKTIYYFGCWWNRLHKNRSIPTFLLQKDIERALTDGMKYYDLEVGDEPYKRQWDVIRKPTKYYAILPAEMAEYLEIEKYVKMPLSHHNL